jgi:hypothetical protein
LAPTTAKISFSKIKIKLPSNSRGLAMLEKQVPTILSLSRLYSLVAETVGKGSGIKRRKLKTLWRDGAIDRTTEQLLGNIRELDFFKEESKNQTCWPCAGWLLLPSSNTRLL